MIIAALLIVPLLLGAAVLLPGGSRKSGLINLAGYFICLLLSISMLLRVNASPAKSFSFPPFFYVDLLSAYFLTVVSFVTFASALYSVDYIAGEEKSGHFSVKRSKLYYLLFNLFVFTMFCVLLFNNLGLMWIALEMTTLVSAFLVGFGLTKSSIEAAWKYIIICSASIFIALLGIIFLYHSVTANTRLGNLNWTEIMRVAKSLDKNTLKVAFLFVLVGFGTKAGFAPLHTWLPDAHSQAPAPVSAMLSGVLLKTAIYSIIRFMMIVNSAVEISYTRNLFLVFGLISLGVAAAFILVQKDLKRLLAYHSVEHMGLLCIGIGFGGAGLIGMLLHTFNHAVTKALMFCGAGTVARKYRTTNMHGIRGLINVMPFTGTILIVGAFALGGMPPFSIFVSELIILFGGFSGGHYIASAISLVFLAVIFAGIITHFSRMVFGKSQETIPKEKEGAFETASFLVLFTAVLVLGVFIPAGFFDMLNSIAVLINGSAGAVLNAR